MRRDVLIERHLIRPVAPAPEAMAVARLVDSDAVDPGTQARLSAEPMDGTKDAEEHVLGEIKGLVAVAEEVDRKLNHHSLVLRNELGAGQFVAGRATLHKRRLTAVDVRPTGNPRLLHREFHYTNFRPRAAAKVPIGW